MQYCRSLCHKRRLPDTYEVYRTVVETMLSIAWVYLVIFIFTLIAYVIVRGFEFKNTDKSVKPTVDAPKD